MGRVRKATEMQPFERGVNQDLFYYILGKFYKEVEDEHDYVFENETFSLRYYNWGNHDDETDDEDIFHFYHKPSGLKIGWYKHPFRAALCNMEVTHEEFRAVLYDCRNSIQRTKVMVKEWWKDEERALHLVSERECKFNENQYPLRVDEIETDVEDIILEQWFEEE